MAALVNGKGADIVIGQPDFFSSSSNYNGITASSLSAPSGIAVDSSGNLYVADQDNNRVLEYNTPFVVTGEAGSGDNIADELFGQFDNFTNGGCHLGAGGLCAPSGVALDDMGDLYIADYSNNRVLEYSFPSITTTANLVFGQGGSFTTNVAGTSNSALDGPTGVAVDSADNLYVADYNNSRVLEYNTPRLQPIQPPTWFSDRAAASAQTAAIRLARMPSAFATPQVLRSMALVDFT